jgi:outer membrane receptor for ferrienterochelin and colicins
MLRRVARAAAGIVLVISAAAPLQAQPAGIVRALVESAGGAVEGAGVRAGGVMAVTDESGRAVLHLAAGRHVVRVEAAGLAGVSRAVDVRAGVDTTITFLLSEAIELESIMVVSTRTGRRIEDEPLRVEVLGREEIEEKMLMTPGDIAMMLNETSGLRVQTTSPSLGGAGVRIQGLRGRYTLLLADGLPLYGAQAGALSMLQIPPMDLGQVEVIKGVASALYGSSALGGVVNLIARRPDGEREVLLNQTTRNGTDAVLFASGELTERAGFTLLAGAHRQSMHDANDDGWADLPGYRRALVRPRLFWDDDAGRSLFVTVGGTIEEREGGTLAGAVAPGGSAHVEALDTRRLDAGLSGSMLIGGSRLLTLRASAMTQRHDHRFGAVLERDRHATAFGEVAASGSGGRHLWVAGVALQHEDYAPRDVPWFSFTRTTPSVFVQDEVSPVSWLAVTASARLDLHEEFDAVVSPRLSILLRPGGGWNVRASAGTGHFAPSPFTQETEVIGLSTVAPLNALVLERARSGSIDVGRTVGPVELNGTLFGSEIRHPLMLRTLTVSAVELFNAPQPTRTWGTDLLARMHEEPFHVTATYTYTRSTEYDPTDGMRREAPLTPRHAAGIVAMWEPEDAGRIAAELYYTGSQRLAENPWRERSPSYVILGLLGEVALGRARVFLNAENLLDARQTRHDPLLLPARSPDGRWTTDVWAPLEGRTFNAGVRLAF